MSSLSKMLSVIDLFAKKNLWTAEEISEHLGVSVPTSYRYLKELGTVGLVSRVTGGSYILGPKIIELDYQLRSSDPMITTGKPIMVDLCKRTGGLIILGQFYNDRILTIYGEISSEEIEISYTRGMANPLFKTSTSKIILAYLPKPQLERLSSIYQAENDQMGLSWEDYKLELQKFRRQGYAISHGEVDPGFSAIAAPIFNSTQVIGSISILFPTLRLEVFDEEKLILMVKEAAKNITDAQINEE